ncbi:MFS transporter [Oerskovia flava]|uniref:MFS transporter n=1 Tax=Oerskovia flava TaxID=2986422 RepID=UPI0022403E1B|nr:MFS transporter [Oerskovia sp. JB1-3-2]
MTTDDRTRTRVPAALVARAPGTTSEPLLTPAFLALSFADLAYFTAVGVTIYTLPTTVTGPVGSDLAGAGLAFGVFALAALVLRPLAGRAADRHGRRPLLVGGALLGAVMLAATAHVDALGLVVVLRAGGGVAEAAFVVASFAALADLAPRGRTGEALSYNSLGLYVGLALGPALGELTVRSLGTAAGWYAAAALSVVAAVLALRVGETRPRSAERSVPGPLVHRPSVAPGLGFLASVVAMGGFLAFAPLHAGAIGLVPVSAALGVYGSVVVVCRIVFARVPDAVPPLLLGAGALVLMAGGLVLVALWATVAGMIVGTAVLAVGVAFCTPAFFAAIFAAADPADRGAAAGTASVFLDLGLGGGPIVLGLVAQGAGVPWSFAAAGGLAVLGGVWTLGLHLTRGRRGRRDDEGPVPSRG